MVCKLGKSDSDPKTVSSTVSGFRKKYFHLVPRSLTNIHVLKTSGHFHYLEFKVSNSMEYETNEKKKLKLVDIPGNDRIRKSELEKYKVSRVFLRNI